MSMHGTITQIENQGTIVQVWMRTYGGRTHAVNFDHRPFWHMVAARGAHRLIRVGATYTAGEDNATLHFDDKTTTGCRERAVGWTEKGAL